MKEREQKSFLTKKTVRLGGHDVNGNGFIKIPKLMELLQMASLENIIHLKASLWDMEEDEVNWVLLRKRLDIKKLPKQGDIIHILTYPSGFDKFFAERDYLIFNEEKELLMTVASTWALMHLKYRKISRIPDHILDVGLPKDVAFLQPPDKHAVKIKSIGLPYDTRKFRPYDMDWNGHVNNLVMMRFLMESHIEKGMNEDRCKTIYFSFKNEAQLGEEVDIFLNQNDNIRTASLISKDDLRPIAGCKIELL